MTIGEEVKVQEIDIDRRKMVLLFQGFKPWTMEVGFEVIEGYKEGASLIDLQQYGPDGLVPGTIVQCDYSGSDTFVTRIWPFL